MAITLQFSGVNCGRTTGLTFALEAGEIGVLRMTSKEEKIAAIEMAVGERIPEAGVVALNGAALEASPRGSIGWVPGNGGLISNLKTWENVTLPLWYHGKRHSTADEDKIAHWLTAMGVDEAEAERYMASPAGRLTTVERKRTGLLRGLLLAPKALVVDVALFDGLAQNVRTSWIELLDAFALGTEGSSVLVVADSDVSLPWKTIG